MTYPLYPADPTRDPAEPFRNLDTSPTTVVTTAEAAPPGSWDEFVDPLPETPEAIAERQRQAFGGPKVGSAFFGWLTASALTAVLLGLFAGVDATLGLGLLPDPWASGGLGPIDGTTVGWSVVALLLGFVLVAFLSGGYVAGRMARFSGVAQGLVVWLWAIVIGIVAGILGALADSRFGFLDDVAGLVPRLPVAEEHRAIAWILGGVALAVVSLVGAVLGGVAGLRYHRRVDRIALDS